MPNNTINEISIILRGNRLARKVAEEIITLQNESTDEKFEFHQMYTLSFGAALTLIVEDLSIYAAKELLKKVLSVLSKRYRSKRIKIEIKNKVDNSSFKIPNEIPEFKSHYRID